MQTDTNNLILILHLYCYKHDPIHSLEYGHGNCPMYSVILPKIFE